MMRFACRRPAMAVAGAARYTHDSPIIKDLKGKLLHKKEETAKKVQYLVKNHSTARLSEATVEKAYGGMRDICGLVYEPSLLDSHEGIRFRGLSIPECQEKLPKGQGSEMLPEAMFWLLLTGDVPTEKEATLLNQELHKRACDKALGTAKTAIDALPQNCHPMTQFSSGILALQHHSKFAGAYAAGKANKSNYWELAFEDSLDLMARSPTLAAMIYKRITTGSSDVVALNPELDWAANFSQQMGFLAPDFADCMRLYLSIHVDHEGGNVSAHTTTLVGSALSDPYLAFSAGLNGLAGPLHGLANQEVLTYLFDMLKKCHDAGVNMNSDEELKKALTKFTWDLLNSKRVVPGYGHAVLRKTDPRYTCQREFCAKHFPNDELFRLVDSVYQIMPGILTEHGKTKNPYPNVDAHSGVLLQHYGLKEQSFYTVLFGVSRQLGVLSGLIWDRLQGRPIERPKSITTDALYEKFHK